jgi:hypothetical protein
LPLCWGHVRDRTILVERAVSLGELKDTKTRAHRTVRLLAPLQDDLQARRRSCGDPADGVLVFPGPSGRLFTKTDWDNWRRRAFDAACVAISLYDATPYDLRPARNGSCVTGVSQEETHA